ncbi:flagellin lysine-N-methylase [Myxococcus fulvus]|uniref:flagellin lysine-N-methylase n=1 Tax=Myxococcus TaxID=32 RepID=UPI0020BEFFD7|nr:flagellin lysine-N-methylase [Myxococcus fulvus]MCK8498754.1 flagellin lysine-N-methylase [Myxococcus fulvus]
MSATAPRYLTRFQCLADTCEDTCCAGLVVPVSDARWKVLRDTVAGGPDAARVEALVLPDPSSGVGAEAAYIAKREDGLCSFLDARRLCSLHRAYGEAVLPDACAVFPRVATRRAGRLEVTGSFGCPEVVRLCLLAEDALEPVPVDASLAARPELARALGGEDAADAWTWHASRVRDVALRILERREYPYASRLFMLGELARRLGAFYFRGTEAFAGEGVQGGDPSRSSMRAAAESPGARDAVPTSSRGDVEDTQEAEVPPPSPRGDVEDTQEAEVPPPSPRGDVEDVRVRAPPRSPRGDVEDVRVRAPPRSPRGDVEEAQVTEASRTSSPVDAEVARRREAGPTSSPNDGGASRMADALLLSTLSDFEAPSTLDALHAMVSSVRLPGGPWAGICGAVLRARIDGVRGARFQAWARAIQASYGGPSAAPDDVWALYSERRARLEPVLGERIEQYFRHHAVNHWLRNPFTDSPSVMDSVFKLTLRAAMLRWALFGHPEVVALCEDPSPSDARARLDAAAVECFQLSAKHLEQSPELHRLAQGLSGGAGPDSLPRMLVLLQGV